MTSKCLIMQKWGIIPTNYSQRKEIAHVKASCGKNISWIHSIKKKVGVDAPEHHPMGNEKLYL